MDTIEVEILKDGTLKASIQGKVSPGNHRNADEALRLLAELMGGDVEIEAKMSEAHRHEHQDQHARQGG